MDKYGDLREGLIERIGFEEFFDMFEMFFHGGDIFLFELFLEYFHFHMFLLNSVLFIFWSHLDGRFDGDKGMKLMSFCGFSEL